MNNKEEKCNYYLCGEITKTGIAQLKIPIRDKVAEMVTTAIDKAKERFKDVDGQIKELEDTSLQTEANNLKEIMTNRFDVYDELYNHYTTSLKQETELYELFKEKDAAKEDLEAKIEEINKTYDSLMESNKKFNELTNEYNEEKIAFYKNAKLDVDVE